MRVEIGGGPSPQHRDWEQYDAIDWSERTALRYTLGDIRRLPYADGTLEEIFASNVLEHVSFLETNATLVEWRRVLVPQGRLTVVVPDVLGIINDYLNNVNSWDECSERLYGSQTYVLDLHRAGFTAEHMPTVFERAGFEVLSCERTHAGGGVTIIGTPRRDA